MRPDLDFAEGKIHPSGSSPYILALSIAKTRSLKGRRRRDLLVFPLGLK